MTRPRSIPHDVVVLGGGPAGAAAAILLAGWGHDVALVTRERPRAAGLAESIPPSARRLLDGVGVLTRMENAGLLANRGNTVWWANGRERSEPFPAEAAGFQAERSTLEKIFDEEARAVGVAVSRSTVRRVERVEGDGRAGPWRVEPSTGPVLHAGWVLDATGRAGVLAKPRLREPESAAPTLALVRRWRCDPDTERATYTLVESYRDGWAWSVPLAGGQRCVTAMVDPRVTDLRAGASLGALYEAEIAKTRQLARLVEGSEPVGGAWACPASLYGSRTYGGPGFLLVGDAGSFIDPLSSYGVKKALASAWLSAVVVHTALSEPDMADEARAFHDGRERRVYASYRRLSAPFFREAALAYGHPFWQRRADAAAAAGGVAPDTDPADRLTAVDDGEALPPRHAVEGAWNALRIRESLEAASGASVRVVRRPALEGNRIVLAEHLASDVCPDGIRWLHGVALPDLVRAAPDFASVPDLFEHCAKRHPAVALPAFLTALATAFAGGFLQHRS